MNEAERVAAEISAYETSLLKSYAADLGTVITERMNITSAARE